MPLTKPFLFILLCLSSYLFGKPAAGNASSAFRPALMLEAGKAPVDEPQPKHHAVSDQALKPGSSTSAGGVMEPELLALLLLIMLLGMLYPQQPR